MNLKQRKPIHLRCPKCSYDFAYNSNHIESEIDRLKIEITQIVGLINDFKKTHPNPKYRAKDNEYRNLQSALNRRNLQLAEYKRARKATVVEIEAQKNKIFQRLVYQKIGKEETLKLVREAEDQMAYYEYDTAHQTFTRFEGA